MFYTCLIFFMTVLMISSIDIYLPFAPHLAEVFEVEPSILKISFLLGPLISCLISFPIGIFSDKYGRRPFLLAGLIVWELGALLCGFAPGISLFMIGRLFQSLGVGCLSVLAASTLADRFHGLSLAKTMSLYSTLFPLTFACSPIIGAQIGQIFGWRSIFFTISALMAIALVLIALFLPETCKKRESRFSFVLPETSTIFLALAATLPAMVGAIFTVNAPFLFVHTYHLDPATFSYLQATPIIFQILGVFFYRQWIGRKGIGSAFLIGACTAFVFILLSTVGLVNPYGIVPVLALFSFGVPFISSTASTMVLDGQSEQKGFAVSSLNVLRNLLLTVGVSASSYFCDETLFPLLMCMQAVAFAVLVLAFTIHSNKFIAANRSNL